MKDMEVLNFMRETQRAIASLKKDAILLLGINTETLKRLEALEKHNEDKKRLDVPVPGTKEENAL